ncbi:sensor histidine kinase [Dactylosporangium darangshiense]|uniref:histidine kinase n=1 Tax=Dactylosporangium darangshiense TaxID=579108 RepID=A0ABP8DL43_9ACTN
MTLVVALGSWAGWASLADTTRASDRLQQRISPAATAVVELGAALVDQETSVRGYLLTRDAQFLAPYRDGLATERRVLADLHGLLSAEPGLPAMLDRVESGAAVWRARYAEPLIAAPDPQSPLVVPGKAAFDVLRADVAALQQRVDAARSDGRRALEDARQRRDTIFTAIVAGLLVGLLAIALLLQWAVLRPLERLQGAVRRVADGDFDHRVPAAGPRDLAELGADVEAMRGRIVAALADSRAQQELLRRSNSDLEQFAYVASHDLQEPLRKIASFCQMLQRRYSPQLDDRAQQYIAFAVDGATRMQALINDLLAFSRVGRVYDSVAEVDLNATLRRVRSDLAVRLEDAGAEVECPRLPVIQGDSTLLAMLWQNLISNAVKFRKPDAAPRIAIGAAPDSPASAISPASAEGPGADNQNGATAQDGADGQDVAEWRFWVQDNGIGIEPQFEDKVFVIFQRLHPRDVYPGTGIGLAICKRIVEHHGGRIWLDADYTAGARICFTLPARQAGRQGASSDSGIGHLR